MSFWKRHNYSTGTHCAYCNVAFSEHVRKTKDHIIPTAKGGKNHISNYIAACEWCNGNKGMKSLFSYALFLEQEGLFSLANRAMKIYNKCGRKLGLKYYKKVIFKGRYLKY
jgi:hypothetical protein